MKARHGTPASLHDPNPPLIAGRELDDAEEPTVEVEQEPAERERAERERAERPGDDAATASRPAYACRVRSLFVAAPLLWLACSEPARPPAPPGRSPPARQVTRPAPPAPRDPKCEGDLAPHREVLVRGRSTEIARGGVRATYRGHSEDHFDDGTTAIVLSLEVDGEPWLPDARERAFHALGKHCLRIVTSGDDRLELDVALEPTKQKSRPSSVMKRPRLRRSAP